MKKILLTAIAVLALFTAYAQNAAQEDDPMDAVEQLWAKLESGTEPAPDFTLDNMAGEPVSLSSLKGKWVIIDFWGSWCGWCIKGMPEMKKAYEEYSPKLEILGVDCGDSKEAWKFAVDKHKLPWLHVYMSEGDMDILKQYGVVGFPTKIIVNPEGYVAKVFVGEDPSFYTTLAELIK